MSHSYSGSVVGLHTQTPVAVTVPDDGDAASAASVNTAFQALSDRMEAARRDRSCSVRMQYGGISALGTSPLLLGDYQMNWTGTAPSLGGGSALTNYNSGGVKQTPAGNGDVTSVTSFVGMFYKSYLLAVLESDVALSVVGANNVTVQIGIIKDPTTAHFGGARFKKASGDTTWKCECDDGTTTTTVDSGVTPVVNAMNFFRIEYYGSGLSGGPKALFYIDGNLVATISTNLYTGASALQPYVYSTGTAANATTILVGRQSMAWTRASGF